MEYGVWEVFSIALRLCKANKLCFVNHHHKKKKKKKPCLFNIDFYVKEHRKIHQTEQRHAGIYKYWKTSKG